MYRAVILLTLAFAAPVLAEDLEVNPDAGNNSFSAVFEAKLGERITAVSSAVGCEIRYEEKSGLASGTCSVPLKSIRVDNDDTKSDHFQQWATNKRSEPASCRLNATFEGLKIGALVAEQPVAFQAEIPFKVCGRARVDGKRERVTGTALLFPAGSYGDKMTIRIRATVPSFDRDAYHIGPKYTEGWLARVQSLAKIVAERGTVELSLFAHPKAS